MLSFLQIRLINQERVLSSIKKKKFKGCISKGKALGRKKQWTHKRVDEASD